MLKKLFLTSLREPNVLPGSIYYVGVQRQEDLVSGVVAVKLTTDGRVYAALNQGAFRRVKRFGIRATVKGKFQVKYEDGEVLNLQCSGIVREWHD